MVILRTDGREDPYPPANGKTYTLDELKRAIGGGYIELVMSNDRTRYIVVDDSGKLKGLPVNRKASLLYEEGDLDSIAGDALVCDTRMIK